MASNGLVEYANASPDVRAVYDDIMATRKTDWINNFWKALANDPVTLKRTWESIKQIMAPGALDPLTKEMIYVAVSVTNQCGYCIASHTAAARKRGMTDGDVSRADGRRRHGQRNQSPRRRLPDRNRSRDSVTVRRPKQHAGAPWRSATFCEGHQRSECAAGIPGTCLRRTKSSPALRTESRATCKRLWRQQTAGVPASSGALPKRRGESRDKSGDAHACRAKLS